MANALKKRWFIVAGLSAAALITGIVWMIAFPSQPAYGGERLSVWLDQLCTFDSFRQRTQGTNELRAIRAIGTNAIPGLLHQYRQRGDVWKWRVNQLLNKQHLIKFRFRNADARLYRATVGFRALGELGEPAIPGLLSLVEACPGYVPGALAGIGRPAIPALHRCLTNMTLYKTSIGSYAVIPGNTISDIFNATSLGDLKKSDTGVFLPAIRAWAQQTTNTQAQTKAQWFLEHYDQLQ